MISAMSKKYKNRYIVYGRVQGVGFRRFARNCANEYSIGGYVRNLPDGNVEIEAIGEPLQIRYFLEKIAQGSWFSDVENIEEINSVQTDFESAPSFLIVR